MGAQVAKVRNRAGSPSPSPRAPHDSHAGPQQPRVERFMAPQFAPVSTSMMTWNIAAVNNNPFEYWISYTDPSYLELMNGVELFLKSPEEHDVEVQSIFTQNMFADLKVFMEREGIPFLDELERYMWNEEADEKGGPKGLALAKRRIVSGFIKDKQLGAKRLISMPDRVTNTINVVTRVSSCYRPPCACRPTVINNFEGDMSSMEVWWEQWKTFMFHTNLTVRTKGGTRTQRPVEMLEGIPSSKYPAITLEEEKMAIPLQILCQAIFDSVLVHFMNLLSPDNMWQVVKSKICDKLYRQKEALTMQILERSYTAIDVIALQEVAAVCRDKFTDSELSRSHTLIEPAKLDGKRDQNSLIFLRKECWEEWTVVEVTPSIERRMPSHLKLADGDLLVITVMHKAEQRPYLIVSFHGDTNGMLTMPLINAVDQSMNDEFNDHIVLMGLDANCYEIRSEGKLFWDDFLSESCELGLTTCWGDKPDSQFCRTTYSARTSLQPQLQKAVGHDKIREKGDMNPKDTILFKKSQVQVVPPNQMGEGRQPNPLKDNTGCLFYKEETVFPSMEFPSDHGIVAVTLQTVGAN